MDEILESTAVPLVLSSGKTVYLKLLSNPLGAGCREVSLAACDSNGCVVDRGFILDVQPNGTLFLRGCVNERLGLKLASPYEGILVDQQ